jgi:recombination protein RecA
MAYKRKTGAKAATAKAEKKVAEKQEVAVTKKNVSSPATQKLIANIVKKADKKLGGEALQKLGDESVSSKVSMYIPTGNAELTKALGLPGYPVGRIVEIYGAESSGKSTIAQSAAAECQALGGIVIYIDTEFALDPDYATKLGVNIDDVLLSQPESMEEAIKILEEMVEIIRSESMDVPILVIWDSVAASPTEHELKEGKAQVGEHARLMSAHLRQTRGLISKSNVVAIYINQIRDKIGVMFGDNTDTFGGRALKFYSSIRLEVKKVGQIKSGENVVGNKTRITVKKNKLAAPFKKAELAIMFGKGMTEDTATLFEVAANAELISKKGKKYIYETLDGEEVEFTKKQWDGILEEYPEIKERLSEVDMTDLKKDDDED